MKRSYFNNRINDYIRKKIIITTNDNKQIKGILKTQIDTIYISKKKILVKDIKNIKIVEKEYKYVSVIYDDDEYEREYSYKTNIKDIKIGDKVLVDRRGEEVFGEVVGIHKYTKDTAPFPIKKTKDNISVVTNIDEWRRKNKCCMPYEDVFEEELKDQFFQTGSINDRNLKGFCEEMTDIDGYLCDVGESIAGCFEIYVGTTWYMASKEMWQQDLVDEYKEMLIEYERGDYDLLFKEPKKDKKLLNKHIAIINKYIEKHDKNKKKKINIKLTKKQKKKLKELGITNLDDYDSVMFQLDELTTRYMNIETGWQSPKGREMERLYDEIYSANLYHTS